MKESILWGIKNRLFQALARVAPGAESFRVWLHRSRGVNIGKSVWIGYDAIIETSRPSLVTINDGASIGIRVTIIAHFRETQGVTIGKNAFIGPGAILLPGVVIGEGAVVTAGSIVSKSIPPMVVAQGNPAVAVARCGVPLLRDVSVKQFSRKLRPLSSSRDDT